MSTESANAREWLEARYGPLTLGMAIRSLRLSEEISLVDLATRLGISRQHLCDVEQGRRGVSVERAAEWARVLEHPESVFIGLALQDQARAAGVEVEVKVIAGAAKGRRKARRDDGRPPKKRASGR